MKEERIVYGGVRIKILKVGEKIYLKQNNQIRFQVSSENKYFNESSTGILA